MGAKWNSHVRAFPALLSTPTYQREAEERAVPMPDSKRSPSHALQRVPERTVHTRENRPTHTCAPSSCLRPLSPRDACRAIPVPDRGDAAKHALLQHKYRAAEYGYDKWTVHLEYIYNVLL